MSNTENSNVMNLSTRLEQTSSLIEELAKPYAQIEAQDDASCNKVGWKDIEGHFHHFQSGMKKKLEYLEAKEKDVTEKEKLLAQRETTVTAKEQDLLDRVQELKDAVVADIMEVKTYLKDVRRNLQGNGLPETQNDFNARELTAVKAVLRCVKDYKLEDEFPLDTLKKRFIQLQNSVRDKKRNKDKYKTRRRESHTDRASLEPEDGVSENGRQAHQVSSEYAYAQANDPNSYYHAQDGMPSAAPNAYGHQVSSQYAYAQVNDPNLYYHAQNGMTSDTPYPGQAPVVDASLQPPQYPYM